MLVLIIIFVASNINAQMTVNGILDSSVSIQIGSNFSLGIEEYANIRFQSRVRDRAVVYGAVNLIVAAGTSGVGLASVSNGEVIKYKDHNDEDQEIFVLKGFTPTAFAVGENYIAGIELERPYFRIYFESADLDAGLFRLPFGFSQVWGSSDFLNPRNPLKPDARPRGILGAGFYWYPNDDMKLLGFGAMPRNPFLSDGGGIITGVSMDRHFDKASIQALYSFELPSDGAKNGIHRAGFSVKADLEIGVVMDMLYSYNHEAKTEIDGLSLSVGADYSLFDGNMIVLGEYLYNGKTSSTAWGGYGGDFIDRHYIYTGVTWRFNDFTNISGAFITGIDKFSFTPFITLNHDLFQGAALTASLQMPLDRSLFDGDRDFSLITSARLRLRF